MGLSTAASAVLGSVSLAVWPKPVGVELVDVERELLRAWESPPNLKDVHTPWSGPLSDARRVLRGDPLAQLRAGD